MSYEFEYMMHLAGCSAQGIEASAPVQPVDFEKLLDLAREQGIQPLIAHILRRSSHIDCPQALMTPALSNMRQAIAANYMRRNGIVSLLERFEAAGIHAVLLKGFALATEYAVPELRLAGDADILVSRKDEARAYALLAENGFHVDRRAVRSHHGECYHPQLGTVELHVMLYETIVENVWFDGMDGFVIEPHERITLGDGHCYVLGKTDTLIYLAIHMIKHFINSGNEVRMMLDLGLYFDRHGHELDTQRLLDIVERFPFMRCLYDTLHATIQYCAFDASIFPPLPPKNDEAIALMMDDMESGGMKGNIDQKSREDGLFAFNREMILKKKGKSRYLLFMLSWYMPTWLSALFPSRSHLEQKYPYLSKKPWLLPYAWLHRFFVRGTAVARSGDATRRIVGDEETLTQSGQERVTLFKKLDMMP